MEMAVDRVGNLILRDLKSTTRTWKHKPAFTLVVHKSKGDYSVIAGTDDKIYGFVDTGTKAHPILPKRSKYLRYMSGYQAKTRVGIIGSNPGGASGVPVFSKGVMHPGFPGRKFILRIQRRRQVTMRQELTQAVAVINRQQK